MVRPIRWTISMRRLGREPGIHINLLTMLRSRPLRRTCSAYRPTSQPFSARNCRGENYLLGNPPKVLCFYLFFCDVFFRLFFRVLAFSLFLCTTRFLTWNISDWYLSLRTNIQVGSFDEKTKTASLPGRRREHGRGPPRQGREKRAWWGTSSKHHTHRMVNLISS